MSNLESKREEILEHIEAVLNQYGWVANELEPDDLDGAKKLKDDMANELANRMFVIFDVSDDRLEKK